jgi:hypothetical protein
MKKLLIVLAVMIFATAAMAETKNLTFAWEQATADLPNLKEWTLYVQRVQNGPFTKALTIPYTTGAGPTFTAKGTFELIAPPATIPGVLVKNWFHMTATSKSGNESGPSNEVPYEFSVPWPNVTVPLKLNVTVSITP